MAEEIKKQHNLTGSKDADKKIGELSMKYPELFVGSFDTPIGEMVRAAYEVESMKTQKLYNKVLMIMTGLVVILTVVDIYLRLPI